MKSGMKYKDIASQWNSLINDVRTLQENITECLNGERYETEQQKQDLKAMRKGCYELLRILLGYFD